MDSDHMFHLNFAITLFNHGDLTEALRAIQAQLPVRASILQARRQFVLFSDLFQQLDEEQRNSDPEVGRLHSTLWGCSLSRLILVLRQLRRSMNNDSCCKES